MSKLDGIKPGDRVRVTFEGVALSVPLQEKDTFSVKFESNEGRWFAAEDWNAPTFHIEKLAPPLKVGDRVTWGNGVDAFELVATRGDYGVLYSEDTYKRATLMRLSELRAAQ